MHRGRARRRGRFQISEFGFKRSLTRNELVEPWNKSRFNNLGVRREVNLQSPATVGKLDGFLSRARPTKQGRLGWAARLGRSLVRRRWRAAFARAGIWNRRDKSRLDRH
jgi:hypothetical protein